MRVVTKAVLIVPASVVLLLGLAGGGASAAQGPAGVHARVGVPGSGHAGQATIPDRGHTARAGVPDSGYIGSCNQGPYDHYYGAAFSGTGSHGTVANIWTWKQWSVDPSGQNFSLEAVGLNDANEVQYSLETGFYSGWANDVRNGHGVWNTNGMTPYCATDNGTDGYVQQGTYLP